MSGHANETMDFEGRSGSERSKIAVVSYQWSINYCTNSEPSLNNPVSSLTTAPTAEPFKTVYDGGWIVRRRHAAGERIASSVVLAFRFRRLL